MAWAPLLALIVTRIGWQSFTRITALGYRPVRPPIQFRLKSTELQFNSPASVVTLIDRDDADALARGMLSWLTAGVREIIVLAGPEAQRCHQLLEHFPVIVIRSRADPRLDLIAGWRAATGRAVAIVDPGTVWARDVAQRTAGSFMPSVGVVAIRHNSYHVGGLAHRLADIDEDLNTIGMAAAGSRLDRAVINSWKGTAVFRRSALLRAESRFSGHQLPIAEPRQLLADIVMDSGATAVYQPLARDWPIMTGSLRELAAEAFVSGVHAWPRLRQNAFRRPAWQQPYRAVCALAWLLAGPATLVGLGYGGAALWAGVWQLALVLLAWALISHALLLIPHLWRRPSSVLLVPVHATAGATLGLVRFAGLLTGAARSAARRSPAPVVNVLTAEQVAAESGDQPEPMLPVQRRTGAVVIKPEFRLMPITQPIPLPQGDSVPSC